MTVVDERPPPRPQTLVEQVTRNRMVLARQGQRMMSARSEAVRRLQETSRLLRELQQEVDAINRALAVDRSRKSTSWFRSGRLARPDQEEASDHARRRLHEVYAVTRDPAVRDELVASYDGLARALAVRYRHRESVDDLIQVARIGLLNAIDRFDPAMGRPFTLFARLTISGELKRYLRDKTWTMRVPRSLQEDYLVVVAAVEELTAEQSVSPSMEAVAGRCGLSIERVVEALELRFNRRTLSTDTPAGTGIDDLAVEIGREDMGFAHAENRQLLAHLLGRLPERDRRILELRFIDDMTQAEIAAKVGVSQMCVSRVLARTLGRLRVWARSAVA